MESIPKIHHSRLSFLHRHSLLPKPFTSLSFRSLPPSLPFSSSSQLSCIRASSPSPSPSPKDHSSHKPRNAFTYLLQNLNPLFSPLFEPVYVAIAAVAFFFMRVQLKPVATAKMLVPPAAESSAVTTENLSDESAAVSTDEENEKAIEEQLSKNPGDADVIRSLVEVKVRARKIGEAIQLLDRLIELDPEEFEWPLLKAHLYGHNGEHELARNGFEDLLKKDPLFTEAYHGLLMATSELDGPTKDLLKRIEEAIKSCEEQKMSSEVREFKLLMAQIKVMEEDYSGALKVYQELVKEEPRDFRPYLCQGVVYTLLRKKDEADKQFEKYRKLVPENHPYKEYFEDNTKVFSQELEKGRNGTKS
ncbi:Tetratricopeptide-like helical domain superfamily [Sesbania bispinosa]|nr:Tetratricopeptide-like helical domain superfamily [Sesbania bispinosa]